MSKEIPVSTTGDKHVFSNTIPGKAASAICYLCLFPLCTYVQIAFDTPRKCNQRFLSQ